MRRLCSHFEGEGGEEFLREREAKDARVGERRPCRNGSLSGGQVNVDTI